MSYDLMFKKAIELQNIGALNEAEDIYLKMLQAMPENSDVWNLLGLTAQSKGDLKRANDCFLSAIRFSPKPFAPYFFNLGLAYRALGKKKEALDALQQAVKLQPDFKEGWNFLGLAQEETGEQQQAIRSFCKALELDNNYNEARANLCFYTKDKEKLFQLADEQEGNFQVNLLAADYEEDFTKKEYYLRRAVAANPDNICGLLRLAETRRAGGDLSEALQLYHKALNLDDNSIEALLGAADIYLSRENFERAELYYKKSFKLNRRIAGAHLNYGILLYRAGRKSEALEEYRQAAALAPETPEISYNLALITKEFGDYEEALGLMFNAHQRAPEQEQFSAGIMETLTELYNINAETALKIALNWRKTEPDNIFSRRILAGMSGVSQNEKDDALYAEKLFNSFADTYDETLSHLNPQTINFFKQKHGNVKGAVLDLGCGTGMAAAALKNPQAVFDGVDISNQMLEEARKKNVYRNLYQSDILSFLQQNPPALSYSLVLAFDVFCYIGNLAGILQAFKGTELWFSVEAADFSIVGDYYLTPNGRYKHRRSYVETTLKYAGFSEISAYSLILREENGVGVDGFLFCARN